ncbi:GNAT family N-acetyltransferase [Aquimonas sp.]|uniref:GNAT family N-acetyltransferase n=1 Tax=Aquimonas sp. TaxID=1872588 RepID=UPI0037BF1E2D
MEDAAVDSGRESADHRSAGQVLGQIGIEVFQSPRRRHVANIGLGVAESARRRGVGHTLMQAAIEQCFGWLGVQRIELEVYTDNQAAQALFTAHGFIREGTALGYALRAGEHADVHLMARLKDASAANVGRT